MKIDGLQVFSATMARDREQLGERVTSWLQSQRSTGIEIVDVVVKQSSDSEFHCITIVVMWVWAGGGK